MNRKAKTWAPLQNSQLFSAVSLQRRFVIAAAFAFCILSIPSMLAFSGGASDDTASFTNVTGTWKQHPHDGDKFVLILVPDPGGWKVHSDDKNIFKVTEGTFKHKTGPEDGIVLYAKNGSSKEIAFFRGLPENLPKGKSGDGDHRASGFHFSWETW